MSVFDRQTFKITVVRGLKVEVDSDNRPLPASQWKPTLAVHGFDRDGLISQQTSYIDWGGNPLINYNNNLLIGYHQVINVNAGDTIEWTLDRDLITPRPEFVPHGFGPGGSLTEQLEPFRGWGLQIGIPLDSFSTRSEGQQYYKDQDLDIESIFPSLSEEDSYSLFNLIEGYSKWENLCASSTGEDDVIFASPMGGCDSCNDIAPDMYGEEFLLSRRESWQVSGSNSSVYETRLGLVGRKYFTCFPRYCNGSSPEDNSSIVFGPTPYVNIRNRGVSSGPSTDVTTTAAPCIPNEDDIPRDKPEKAKLIYESGSVFIPTGENIHLQIGDNKYPLLHKNSAEVSGGQKMVSVTNIVSDVSVTFSELVLSFKEELNISGQVSISISSHEDKLLLGQKIISAPVKDIVFSCSDIINNIDLQNKIVLITITSICSADKEDCCDDLKCIQLFDKVTNLCLDDPCGITMPLITFFSTKTRTRLLLHDGNYTVLDTGYVNTLSDDIENYLSYEGSDVVFTNSFGHSYVLDYYPAAISKIGSLTQDCNKKVYNKTDLYRYKCFDFNSAVSNTTTWVFPFDICDLTACINPDGEIPPPAPPTPTPTTTTRGPIITATPADFTINFTNSSATKNYDTGLVTDTFRMGLTLKSLKYEQHERYRVRMEQGYANHIWKLICVPYATLTHLPLPLPRIGTYISDELDWSKKIEVDINVYVNEAGLGTDSLVNKEQIIEIPNPFAYSNPGVAPPLHTEIAWRLFVEEPWFNEIVMDRLHPGFQIVGHTNQNLKEPDLDLYPPPSLEPEDLPDTFGPEY